MKANTSTTTQWRCRAECVADAELVKWALRGIAIDMQGEPAWLPGEDAVFLTLPDVGLSFHTDSTLTLEMLRWILSHVTDCHVATESLSEFSAYTAGRDYLDPATHYVRPPADITKRVVHNLEEYGEYLDAVRASAEESAELLAEQVD